MEDIYTDSDRSHSTFSVRTSFGETYPSMFDDSDFKDINANKLKNVLRELISVIMEKLGSSLGGTRNERHKFFKSNEMMQFVTCVCSLQRKSSNETSSQEECNSSVRSQR